MAVAVSEHEPPPCSLPICFAPACDASPLCMSWPGRPVLCTEHSRRAIVYWPCSRPASRIQYRCTSSRSSSSRTIPTTQSCPQRLTSRPAGRTTRATPPAGINHHPHPRRRPADLIFAHGNTTTHHPEDCAESRHCLMVRQPPLVPLQPLQRSALGRAPILVGYPLLEQGFGHGMRVGRRPDHRPQSSLSRVLANLQAGVICDPDAIGRSRDVQPSRKRRCDHLQKPVPPKQREFVSRPGSDREHRVARRRDCDDLDLGPHSPLHRFRLLEERPNHGAIGE